MLPCAPTLSDERKADPWQKMVFFAQEQHFATLT
ncbi:hypothetical protein ABIE13_001847 [Ottowia thiooxydans]|uniref:Uncharacterized protein n=1 Tax=Ottowia thiooxydans TaxID=219182 RepID=A0ABV2Q7A6_9BURK